VTPYYQDDAVTIYHGDCQEIDAWLAADALVTDPPYGRAWKQGDTGTARGWKSDKHDGIANDHDTTTRDAALAMWGTRPAIVFGDLMLAPPTGTKLVGILDKGSAAGFTGAVAGIRRNVEAIYFLGRHPSGLGGRSALFATSGLHGPNLARSTGHPHTKPLDVVTSLVANTVGVVADPFMGSGTTLRAAKDLGRQAIGVELDERWCEFSALRMSQEVLALGGVA
jgi:site-specific DNA-methyltransferase (adenine-specific)